MHKLTAHDPETHSADLIADNLQQLKALFPEAFTEGKIDFEVLKQLLGGAVEEREEKYGLNWHGKRRARQLALTPSTGTLRPCPEDSVDWDTTRNLMIEGDNLEVLKLLQKSYTGKVKLIYIDPPYNTGKDFVYPDDYRDNIRNYLELTGQVEGGRKISSNTDTSGRFHTDWLNMMYPRLKLARNLLKDDGVIFISIDDNEMAALRKICDDVFGEENFVGMFVWRRRASSALAERLVSTDHEYVLAFQRTSFTSLGVPKDFANYSNPDNDPRGEWVTGDLTVGMNKELRPNQFYELVSPKTGKSYPANPNRVWAYIRESMYKLIDEGRIIFPDDTSRRPMLKRFKNELKSDVNPVSTWVTDVGLNTESTKELQDLFGQSPFDYSKPSSLLQHLLKSSVDRDALVLDFFAGSGTTAHAVMSLNAADNGKRRFIAVQLPEPTDLKEYPTIADITKERLRRAAKKIKDENPLFSGDLGFRVFKLDSSNIRAWEPDRDHLAQSLLDATDHLKADRSEQDILFELLLKLGLDLTIPIEQKTIAGKTVHSIGADVLLVCLAPQIAAVEVEPLALGLVDWHKEHAPVGDSQLVFRDSAFADDVAKTNLTAILQQHGLDNVRSL
ncbi:MAG: adenine-specific DNA-methyltransferase [Pseudomonadota bacterium]|nr:adenine-specific DNA-methyltransferase [Pseudomonadota bacterium]